MVEEFSEIFKHEPKESLINKDFLDILKMLAPGTSLRVALDDLLRAKMGALIVFDNGNISGLVEGGFEINHKFSSQKLVELAKMDGAIVLSRDGKEILLANSLLIPDSSIFTKETGTRHKAAERISKQARTISVAVSERKNKISIYYGDSFYELESSSEVLRKASETLQILEKQKEAYDNFIWKFNLLELTNSVTIKDLCLILQKIEIIRKISKIVKRHLIELGKEGTVVNVRLRELLDDLEPEEELILRDYFKENYSENLGILDKMDFEELLDYFNISKSFFDELHDDFIFPRGVRILSKLDLPDRLVDLLLGNFNNLKEILNARERTLLEIFGDEYMVSLFRREIYELKERIGLLRIN
jgi:diadenylate cyclase